MQKKFKYLLHRKALESLFLMMIRGTSLVVKFALTLFIAKFMSFESLGLYGLISATSIMAPPFLGLAIMNAQTRKAVTQNHEEITETLYYYRKYIIFIYSIIFPAALAVGWFIDDLLLAVGIFFVLFLEHINQDLYGLLLNLSKPFTANILHFFRTAGWMLIYMALALIFPVCRTIDTILVGWSIGSFISLVCFFWVTRSWPWKLQINPIPLYMWVVREFRDSKPIYLNNLAVTLSQYTNHFLITLLLGIEMTGVYIYFMQVNTALSNLLQTGVIQVARPKLVRAYKERDPAYKSIFFKYLQITSLVAALMAIASGPSFYFITIYLDKPLAIEWFPIFWVFLCVFVLGMISESIRLIYYAQHLDKLTYKLSLISFPISLMLNAILMSQFNLWGAAFAPLLMCLLFLPIHFYICNHLFKEECF